VSWPALHPGRFRVAALAGAAGPIGFLLSSFVLAWLRHDVNEAPGWASWPSSMALGGPAGIPMILTFCWLGACYLVFALGALRPSLGAAPGARVAVGGFVATAMGDVLLAFPTDGPGAGVSWHGAMHGAGVLVATVSTLVAAGGLTLATRWRAEWRPWRWVAPIPVVGALVGLVGGFEQGWAKVTYVVLITFPAAVAAVCVLRSAGRPVLDRTA
jgi:hypothetical protein